MSGCFPSADNIYDFRDKLYNKVDMVTEQNRWTLNHPEVPSRGGFIDDFEKVDAGYFGNAATTL